MHGTLNHKAHHQEGQSAHETKTKPGLITNKVMKTLGLADSSYERIYRTSFSKDLEN